MRPGSREEYEIRLSRALDYIEAHLDEELRLQTLARIACFSPFHFHRIFRALTGESVRDFVQRRRLERAARRLHYDDKAGILEIALECGYESAAAFSRSFRRRFGCSATEWRREGAVKWRREKLEHKATLRRKNSKIGKAIHHEAWEKMKERGKKDRRGGSRPKLCALPRVRLAYLRYVGPYGSLDITAMWDRLIAEADRAGLVRSDTRCVGVVHDDPAITAPDRCRYDAGIVVAEGTPRGKLPTESLGGGTYLVVPFEGTPLDVDPAWDEIYSRHLPDSGHLPASGPNLEWYEPGAIVDTERMIFRCLLCVPLQSQ